MVSNDIDTSAEKPKRRAPRRATRGVVTPDLDAAGTTTPVSSEASAPEASAPEVAAPAPSAAVSDAPASDAAASDAPVKAAPRKRAPRRASTASTVTPAEASEVAAPAESAPAESAPPAESVPSAEASEPARAPAKSRARKSRAKAAAPVEVESSDAPEPAVTAEAPTAEAAAAPSEAATQAPVKAQRKSRSRRSATTEPVTPEPLAPEPAASEPAAPEPAAPEPAASEPAEPSVASPFSAPRAAAAVPARDPEQRIDVLAAFGLGSAPAAAAEPEVEEIEGDDASQLPATALLFQPPAPSRRRRRRADDADAEAPTAGSESGAAAAATDESEPTEPTDEAAAGDAPRSRGRRSGRRGGGRSTDQNDRTEAGEPAAERETAVEPDEDESDATPAQGNGAENEGDQGRRRRRRGGRGRKRSGGDTETEHDSNDQGDDSEAPEQSRASESRQANAGGSDADDNDNDSDEGSSSSRRRRRRRGRRGESGSEGGAPAPSRARDEVTALKGSTRLEAKRLRRREGRDAGRRRQIITEAEFLARRESVQRDMVVRERAGMTQIAVMEDGVLVEHYVALEEQTSMVGNVYLGRVQNVLPSMEAAFVDLGKGRNAVLYAGEVNWEAAGLDGQPRRIEQALKSGDQILVQVTKDPIGHKGARLTSQVTLAGRYLVLVPSGAMTGISRKLPENERARLKKLLKEIVPAGQGVIVRTAAEGASEEELRRDVERLTGEWADITARTAAKKVSAPALLKGEPELALRVVRDVFNEDFRSLTVAGNGAWETISGYVGSVAPDLAERLHHWAGPEDVFASKRIDEQLAKGMDRKVWLPSGGSLVIDRTEAMTVVDVNTGKFTGSGGTLEETVTRNNIEAAEEIVRQLRLRDIGGIIVIDFIDMVLESNRDLVLRRLIECLGRDRTRHQVAEVTSLGLVQMTRKRVGQGLVEAFSTPCEHCQGRGFMVSSQPHEHVEPEAEVEESESSRGRRRGGRATRPASAPAPAAAAPVVEVDPAAREAVKATLAQIAAAAQHAHDHENEHAEAAEPADAAEHAEAEASDAVLVAAGAPAEDSEVEVAEDAARD